MTESFSSGLIKREDLWLTGKLWNDFHAEADVEKQCRETLVDLNVDYLDLFLIHWPHTFTFAEEITPSIKETWLAMEALVAKGV